VRVLIGGCHFPRAGFVYQQERLRSATLVRFDVQEPFKGIAPGVQQIWVDPGSSLSCYQEYRLGERYLIFAVSKRQTPNDTAAMTGMRDGEDVVKSHPSRFDPRSLSRIYYASQCGGSRPADYPSIDRDLAMLRAYGAGAALPRVLGHVHLFPFYGWPLTTGPMLKGARVIIDSGTTTLRATTDGAGDFSLGDAPAGDYNAWAELPPYRMGPQVILHVPPAGCGYADIQIMTNTSLRGIVLDHRGRPAAKIPVAVLPKDKRLTQAMRLGTETDAIGQFAIVGIPDLDLYLSAGSDHPTTRMPYRRIHYQLPDVTSVLLLDQAERRKAMVLWLEPPLEKTTVTVSVVQKSGRPAANVGVFAFDADDVIAEHARTGANGIAELSCLRGLEYNLKALTVLPLEHPLPKTPFKCGSETERRLVLDDSIAN
jgi:hypothetical protein